MNIDNIIADIKYINKIAATLIPVVNDQVKTVEAEEGAGNGAAKLKYVLATVQAIYTAANGPVPFADILNLVTQIVNAAVDFYNTIGVVIKDVITGKDRVLFTKQNQQPLAA